MHNKTKTNTAWQDPITRPHITMNQQQQNYRLRTESTPQQTAAFNQAPLLKENPAASLL